jgi:hypothetical protein
VGGAHYTIVVVVKGSCVVIRFVEIVEAFTTNLFVVVARRLHKVTVARREATRSVQVKDT